MNDELKIKIEFSIKNTDYDDYQNVLQNFEHGMDEIGYSDLEITEKDEYIGIFYNEDGTKREINMLDLVTTIYGVI